MINGVCMQPQTQVLYMWLGDGGNVQKSLKRCFATTWWKIGFNVLRRIYKPTDRWQRRRGGGVYIQYTLYTLSPLSHLTSFIESRLLNWIIIIKCTFSSSVCKHSCSFAPSSRHWRPTTANGPCRSWTFCFWPAQLDTLWAWRPAASWRKSTKLGTFCSTPCVSPCSKMSVASTSEKRVCPRMKRNVSSPTKTVGAPVVLLQTPAQRSGWLWPRPSLLWSVADCCAPSTKRGCSGLIFLMWDTGLTGWVYFWLVQITYPWIKETISVLAVLKMTTENLIQRCIRFTRSVKRRNLEFWTCNPVMDVKASVICDPKLLRSST